MNQLIGLLLTVLTLVLAVLVTNQTEVLIDPYALLLILGCVFGVMFFSYGSHSFSIFRYASQPIKNQKEYFWVISFFDNLSNTAIGAGVIGTLMGQVAILSSLDDKASLMPATGVSILTIVYGYLLAKLVFEPLKQNVLRKAQVLNINANVQIQIDQNNKLANQFNLLAIIILIADLFILYQSL